MRRRRPSKPDDQENIKKCIMLIHETIELNSMESTLWAAAILSILMDGYRHSDWTYAEFKQEMNDAFDFYEEQYTRDDE